MAVQRVREGERPSDVIASFGMHRCTIYGWLKAARGRGHGLKALAAKPASGRPRSLTARQEHQVFRWINGKNPMQYGFDFGLWTRQIAGDLIAQRFGVTLSSASVGALLARVGLTPQKPLQRAYQRDPEAIARWQRETYPAIARQAKRDKADIYFWDELGFRADAVQGTTWGAKGQTPVVSVPGQRQGISAASAVSAKGAFWFATYAGGLNGTLFVTLLRRMMRGRRKPLHLIVECLAGPPRSAKALSAQVHLLASMPRYRACRGERWLSSWPSRQMWARPHHLSRRLVLPLALIRHLPQQIVLGPGEIGHFHDHLRNNLPAFAFMVHQGGPKQWQHARRSRKRRPPAARRRSAN